MHLEPPGDVLGEDEGTENEYIAVYDDTNESKPLHYTCDGSSNQTARLDDEGFKSVLMSAKELCEDIG